MRLAPGSCRIRAENAASCVATEQAVTFTLAGSGAAPAAAGKAAVASTADRSARRMRRVNACRGLKLRELAPARTRCTAAEALDATAGVHELLTARVEGVTVRADLDMQLRLGGAGPELVA